MATLIRQLMMSLTARLIALSKQRGLTQQQMADTIGIHVNSQKTYEAGHAQPSLDVLKKWHSLYTSVLTHCCLKHTSVALART